MIPLKCRSVILMVIITMLLLVKILLGNHLEVLVLLALLIIQAVTLILISRWEDEV